MIDEHHGELICACGCENEKCFLRDDRVLWGERDIGNVCQRCGEAVSLVSSKQMRRKIIEMADEIYRLDCIIDDYHASMQEGDW